MMSVAKIEALANFLNVGRSEVRAEDNMFYIQDQAFLVLTEDEADEEFKAAVENDLASIDPALLAKFTYKDIDMQVITALQDMGDPGTEALKYLIPRVDKLAKAVEAEDGGRGLFLADDGEENAEDNFYIYRLN